MLNKLLYNIIYLIFYKNPLKSDFIYKLPTFLPYLYIPKINSKTKIIKEGHNILYFNHFNRLYLYSRSLSYRYQSLLSEYCIHPETKFNLNSEDYIIDCGANIGEFSLAFSKHFGFNNFICFEPDPNEFNILSKNFISLKSILVNKALSNSNGFSDFYLDNKTGDSSLLKNDEVNHTIIETITLDSFVSEYKIQSIGLIKIEAEGFEPEILEGAINSLKIIKYICIDCGFERHGNSTFAQVNDLLIKNNFHLLNFNSNRYTMLFCNRNVL